MERLRCFCYLEGCLLTPATNQDLPSINSRCCVSFLLHHKQILGGVDEALYKGELYYVPIRKEWYYDIVMTDISVDGLSVSEDCREVR